MDEAVSCATITDEQNKEDTEDQVLPVGASGAPKDLDVETSAHPEQTKYQDTESITHPEVPEYVPKYHELSAS